LNANSRGAASWRRERAQLGDKEGEPRVRRGKNNDDGTGTKGLIEKKDGERMEKREVVGEKRGKSVWVAVGRGVDVAIARR